MLGVTTKVADIRAAFKHLLETKQFTSVNREATMTALAGSTTVEIVGASFIADEESIFGEVNWDYVRREEEWYYSMSRNVNDIPGGAPQIWKAVADKDGFINSNYGWCIFSPENGFMKPDGRITTDIVERFEAGKPVKGGWIDSQYSAVKVELSLNPESRRAVMIYTRPNMWLDYNAGGRSDFMCTNVVQYLIRNGKLHAVVQMRSNDAVFGYKNDRAWQQHVLEKLANDLSVEPGSLLWNAGSLHVYSRHFHLVDPVGYPKP